MWETETKEARTGVQTPKDHIKRRGMLTDLHEARMLQEGVKLWSVET